MLALATEQLGSSLDFENTMLQTCVVFVPHLADWSGLFVIDEKSSELTFKNCIHRDLTKQEFLKKYFNQSQSKFTARPASVNALRLGKLVAEFCSDESAVSGFLLHLPLLQRSEIIGILTLGSSREFSLEDIQIAEIIAHRATYALDNARIYQASSQMEKELVLAKKKAEDAYKAKSDLLANVSHEIRSPVGAILGFSDLLLMPNKTEAERQDWVHRIKYNGQHLLRLINDILNLSKVESGQFAIESQIVEFSDLFRDLEVTHKFKAVEKNIDFNLQLQSSVPEKFFTDPTRLRQILNNVIDNAIKFTEKGFVRLSSKFDKNCGYLFFDIEDTGPGMTPKQSAQIFQPFAQAGTEHSKRFGGTGLGLALSLKLARLLGGDLELLYSEPNIGSKFRVSIKPKLNSQVALITELKAAISTSETVSEKKNIKLYGKKILIVDDSYDNQYLMKSLLTIKGGDVSVASSGEEVLAMNSINEFDLILMDIQMQGKSGFETTHELRNSGFKKPIIALTANALPQDHQLSRNAGCDGHITKPVDNDELLQKIAELLNI